MIIVQPVDNLEITVRFLSGGLFENSKFLIYKELFKKVIFTLSILPVENLWINSTQDLQIVDKQNLVRQKNTGER